MKKISIIFLMLFLTVSFSACGKKAFIEKKPELSSSLVYIYVAPDSYETDSIVSSCYKVVLADEYTKSCMKVGEYIAYDLKPKNMDFTIIRENIEKRKLKLDLKSGKTYYLRVQSFSDEFAKFNVLEVSRDKALSEIKDTTLVLEYNDVEENQVIVKRDENKNFSKTEELQKAAELKKEGLLTDEEFNKLKAEILAK